MDLAYGLFMAEAEGYLKSPREKKIKMVAESILEDSHFDSFNPSYLLISNRLEEEGIDFLSLSKREKRILKETLKIL